MRLARLNSSILMTLIDCEEVVDELDSLKVCEVSKTHLFDSNDSYRLLGSS